MQEEKRIATFLPLLRRLLSALRPCHGWLLLVLLFGLVRFLLQIAVAQSMAGMVDSATNGDWIGAQRLGFLYIGLLVARFGGMLGDNAAGARAISGSMRVLRCRTAESVAFAEMRVLDGRRTGDIISRLNSDTRILERFLGGGLTLFLVQPLVFIVGLAYVLTVNWKLALLSFVALPLLSLLALALTKPIEKTTKKVQEQTADLHVLAEDAIAGFPVIKSFTLHEAMHAHAAEKLDRILKQGLFLQKLQSLVAPIRRLIQDAPTICLYLFGGILVLRGETTLGTVILFANMMPSVTGPAQSLFDLVVMVREFLPAAARLFELWGMDRERTGGASEDPRGNGGRTARAPAVELERVRFGYGPERKVLDGTVLRIAEGERVALVGPSGTGKSTVIRLIADFQRPESGRVLLFGRDLHDWDPAAARRLLAYMAQDTYLFPDSVEENIRCGRPGADDAAVRAAAEAAGCMEFIAGLPQGFGTPVGERGVKLSAGQRQRLAVARCLLKDAPVLLLDEPTSALDTQSEREVQDGIGRLMAGRTAIVVAHRLSAIRDVDRIAVLAGGRVTEEGTHGGLMALGGTYAQLFAAQTAQEGRP